MLHIQHLFADVLISHFLVIKCSWTNPQPGLMSVNPKNDWNSAPLQTSFGDVVELLIDRLGIGVVYRTPN
jgi:hypothetical protein